MKKFFTIATLVALSLVSCAKEQSQGGVEGEGRVKLNLSIDNVVEVTRATTVIECETPSEEDFSVTIEGVGHTFSESFASIAELNDYYLVGGQYKATVVAGDVTEEGYNKPVFVGSQEFKILPRKQVEAEVKAYIANALVKVEVTEAFTNYFVGGYTFDVVTEAGNTFKDVMGNEEPLFVAPAPFTVKGTATKQANQSGSEGVTVTLPEFKAESVVPQTLYTVKFDVEHAGQATLTISLNDEPVESVVIDTELNDNAQ